MSDNKKNSFLLQSGILAMAGLITRVIGLIYKIPLTRIVGREAMGYYNTAHEIYNLALLISTYSIPVAVSKLISEKESKGEYKNSQKIFYVSLGFSAILGLLMSLLLIFFSEQIASFMQWPSAARSIRFLAPTIFVFSIMAIYRGFFQGKKTMVPTAISQVIEQIMNAVASILGGVLLVKAYKDTSEAASYASAGGTLGSVTGGVFGLIALILIFRLNIKHFDDDCLKDTSETTDSAKAILKMLIITMLPLILSQTIYQISGILDNYMFGSILAGKNITESERSIFYEAYSNRFKWLYNVPVAVSYAFSVSIIPTLSGHFKNGEYQQIKEKIQSAMKLNMLIAIPAAFGLMALAQPILLLLFKNPEDTLSPRLMNVGAIAVIVFAYSTFTNGVLQGIDKMKLPVIHAAISLGIHIVLLYVLLRFTVLNSFALVIGNVTYGLVVCIMNFIAIKKHLDYEQELSLTFIKPLISSLIMALGSYGTYKLLYLLTSINSLSCLFAIFIAVMLYVVSLVLIKGITKEDILSFPKGKKILAVFIRLHLLK